MRVVVYSSVAPEVLHHLLRRVAFDLPDVTVAGVLYETGRPPLPRAKRIRRFLRLLRDRSFLRYVGHKAWAAAQQRVGRLLDEALRWIHAAPRNPNGPPLTLDRLVQAWRRRGVAFQVTSDLHADESLAFVRGLDADLGLIYGTRILKPALFTIPARGSINIHKHKLPEYRGGGRPGLWELQDGCAEQTVTVHRVVEEVDAGVVLGERTFPIEAFDDLDSVQMKADVLAVDLIADVLRNERLGRAVGTPQPAGGRLFKGVQPHQRHALECRIRASRPRWTPGSHSSWWRRLAFAAALPVVAARNWRRTRTGTHPVIVLVHASTRDRNGRAMPVSHVARQVQFLGRHYQIVSPAAAAEMLLSGRVDTPTVVFALDDEDRANLGARAVAELAPVPVNACGGLDALAEAAASSAGARIVVRRLRPPESTLDLELQLQELAGSPLAQRPVREPVSLSSTALPPARG